MKLIDGEALQLHCVKHTAVKTAIGQREHYVHF
ncbi:MAG: hypothetical protein QOG73_4305 [Acetobacteraceae bacterium]|jgi:hypothetical protein|nr:hypothetical protein [Acetobacteraceae bacterium]MEA2791899.1 hypothetical protein [Acetobacteraceae bacterium]